MISDPRRVRDISWLWPLRESCGRKADGWDYARFSVLDGAGGYHT